MHCCLIVALSFCAPEQNQGNEFRPNVKICAPLRHTDRTVILCNCRTFVLFLFCWFDFHAVSAASILYGWRKDSHLESIAGVPSRQHRLTSGMKWSKFRVSGRKELPVVQLSDFNFYSCPEKRGCKLQIGVVRLLCCVYVCKYARVCVCVCIYIYIYYIYIYIICIRTSTKTPCIITVYCL